MSLASLTGFILPRWRRRERDVIRLRTNYRHHPPEDVYLYRLKGTPEFGRLRFLDYMESINAVRTHPQFYNALITNCTATIWTMVARRDPEHLPFSWKLLASGRVP